MLAILLALSMTGSLPAPGEADFNTRIRESVAAAESLQGPLDGGWTLTVEGRPRYVFQIMDPPNGGAVQAAWREWGTDGASTVIAVDQVSVRGRILTLVFTRPGASGDTTVRLHNLRGLGWRGDILEDGRRSSAVLRRE